MERHRYFVLLMLLFLLFLPTWTAPDEDAKRVEVTNFPAVQPIAGTVSIGQMPPVSGAVSVDNLPAV